MRRLLATGAVLSIAIHLGGFVLFAENANVVEMEAARGGSVSVIGALEDMVEGSNENLEAVEPDTQTKQPVEMAEPVEPLQPFQPAEPIEATARSIAPPAETTQPGTPLETSVAANEPQVTPQQSVYPDVIPLERSSEEAKAVETRQTRPVETPERSEPVAVASLPNPVQAEELSQSAEPVDNLEPVAPPAAEPLPESETPPPGTAVPVPVPTRRPDYTPPTKPVQQAKPGKPQSRQPIAEKPKKQAEKKPPSRAQRKGAETTQRKGGQQITSPAGRSNNVGNAQGRPAIGGKASRDNYNGRVLRRLQRAKRYPKQARRDRLRGVAVVRFTVSRSGGVSGVRLARSSGHKILDQEAVAMVSRASPMPAIPQSIGDNAIVFQAPVNFTR